MCFVLLLVQCFNCRQMGRCIPVFLVIAKFASPHTASNIRVTHGLPFELYLALTAMNRVIKEVSAGSATKRDLGFWRTDFVWTDRVFFPFAREIWKHLQPRKLFPPFLQSCFKRRLGCVFPGPEFRSLGLWGRGRAALWLRFGCGRNIR